MLWELKSLLFHPIKTFREVKDYALQWFIRYYFLLLILYSIICGSLEFYRVYVFKMNAIIPFLTLFKKIVYGVLEIFIGGAWLHLWIRILGGKGIDKTIGLVAFARTPYFLFNWLTELPFYSKNSIMNFLLILNLTLPF